MLRLGGERLQQRRISNRGRGRRLERDGSPNGRAVATADDATTRTASNGCELGGGVVVGKMMSSDTKDAGEDGQCLSSGAPAVVVLQQRRIKNGGRGWRLQRDGSPTRRAVAAADDVKARTTCSSGELGDGGAMGKTSSSDTRTVMRGGVSIAAAAR
ncbi:hypothetical protein Syun_026048 [Stephania yunnanensis]|uniref:Uncharacterized protein n=1 Tax=Stephania yunnanensis TaxID=152371 RepID=A0AAP0EYA0_9MAGN